MYDMRLHNETRVVLLGRACAAAGHTRLANSLYRLATECHGSRAESAAEIGGATPSFLHCLQRDVGAVLLGQAFAWLERVDTPREKARATFECIARHCPEFSRSSDAAEYAAQLAAMVAEDRQRHAAEQPEWSDMNSTHRCWS